MLAGAGLACTLDCPLIPAALTVGAGALGGVLPDLDHRKSKITKKFSVVGFFSSRMFRHRGILHTPAFYIAAAVILFLLVGKSNLLDFVIYGLLAGELSHLLLDTLTPQGIPLLWPLYKRHISLLPIQTDGAIDHLIGRLSLISAVCILIYMFVF